MACPRLSFTYRRGGAIWDLGEGLSIWHKRSIKVTVAIGFILLIAALAAVVYVRGQKAKTGSLKIIPDHVDIQVKNVVYTDVGSDGVKWEVKADTATYLRKEGRALFDRVTVKMVLPSGRTFTVKGDKGVLGTESKNMDLAGHVVVLSDQGDRITMDDLHYRDAEKVFKTDSQVFHENDSMKVQGKGMVIYLTTREMKLLSAVRATTKPR